MYVSRSIPDLVQDARYMHSTLRCRPTSNGSLMYNLEYSSYVVVGQSLEMTQQESSETLQRYSHTFEKHDIGTNARACRAQILNTRSTRAFRSVALLCRAPRALLSLETAHAGSLWREGRGNPREWWWTTLFHHAVVLPWTDQCRLLHV